MMTRVDLSATNFAVLHNRPVRCHADCSAIFADFELAFARAMRASSGGKCGGARAHLRRAALGSYVSTKSIAAFEVLDQETYAPPNNIQLFGHSLFAL